MKSDSSTVLVAGVLVVLVTLGGCTGVISDERTSTTRSKTTTHSPTTMETTESPGGDGATTTHSLQDNGTYLRLFKISNSSAMELTDSERVHFRNLSDERQAVFLKALEHGEAKLNGEFVFNDRNRDVKAVLYKDVYYRLNVVKY